MNTVYSIKNTNNKFFIAWLAGFIDGEGCFTIDLRKEPTSRLGWTCYPMITIVLQRSDKFVLEEIQRIMNGTLRNRNNQKSWKIGAKPQTLWRICGWENCLNLAKTIQPYLILKSKRCQIFIDTIKMVLSKQGESKRISWNKDLLIETCKMRDKINKDRSTFRHPNYLSVDILKAKLDLV
jgi:hypothetical protein